MIWNSVEKIFVRGGQFVIGIILARLLSPSDFGLLGMLAIFIAISQTFIDGGLGSGLIQKQDRTDIDYSTVFVFNFIISTVVYCVLFVSAPIIADFFKEPRLVIITRVLMLSLIVNAFILVQKTIFIIKLDFKTIAKINVISVFISGGLGILLAYEGFGVWALIFQNISRLIVTAILFWYFSTWKFAIKFSYKSFSSLFGFSSRLLLSGIYAQSLSNVYNVVIGKYYNSVDLGYYDRSKVIGDLSSGTITSIIQQVSFPIFSSLQNDKEQLILVFRKFIKMAAFIIFPVMTFLSVLSGPFIRVLLTNKWEMAIPLLQLIVFARLFLPINSLNLNLLNSIGRSDLFLKVDLAKFPIIVISLLISIPLGIKAMIIAQIITSFSSFIINSYYPGKLFKYGLILQVKDLIKTILATAISALLMALVTSFMSNDLLKLVLGLLMGLSMYIFSSKVLKLEELETAIQIIKNKINN